mgnify:CR=1 FL=1
MVEEVINELGLSPQESRLQTESGNPAWGLMKGSAQVFVFVNPGTGDEEIAGARLAPVLRTLEVLREEGVWVEASFLMVTGLTDAPDEVAYPFMAAE